MVVLEIAWCGSWDWSSHVGGFLTHQEVPGSSCCCCVIVPCAPKMCDCAVYWRNSPPLQSPLPRMCEGGLPWVLQASSWLFQSPSWVPWVSEATPPIPAAPPHTHTPLLPSCLLAVEMLCAPQSLLASLCIHSLVAAGWIKLRPSPLRSPITSRRLPRLLPAPSPSQFLDL